LKIDIAFEKWPLAFKTYALRRQAGDIGLGDILERDIGKIGGATFKVFWKSITGTDCGCDARKQWINERYPLPEIVLTEK